MKPFLFTLFISAAIACGTFAQTNHPPTISKAPAGVLDVNSIATNKLFLDAVSELAVRLAPRLKAARYLEHDLQPVTVPGWEGFPTMKSIYSVHDSATGKDKTATVILLNPDADRLARWIVFACLEVKGSAATNFTAKIVAQIFGQSGAQYPVRGIVYEDIIPENGINEIYCFRDGVTVKIKGVEHRSERQPTPAEIEQSLNAPLADMQWVGRYARIQSTTREQYQAAGGKEPVEGNAWLDISRKAYQAAWNSDRNELLIDWAKANL